MNPKTAYEPMTALTRRTFMLGTAAVAVTVTLAACSSGSPTSSSTGLINMVAEGSNSFVRTFNPFSPTTRWASTMAMYEPLMISNSAVGKLEPWLASSYAWSPDGATLTFTLRSGVKWSDGKPFTADDVAYTFQLLTQNKALIGPANVAMSMVKSVTATKGDTVEFVLNAPNSTVLYDLAGQFIVPKHVWSSISDPVKFADPNPVATGPYTTIKSFTTQQYEITRNPNYWQKLEVEGLRFKAYSGNDQISAAVVSGQIDWGGLVPNPDTTFVAKDPKQNHYWWPTTGALFLIANATNPLLADVAVRKALSMSLDRKGMIASAVWGKSTPANGVGLMPDGSKQWIYQPAVDSGAGWVTTDVAGANKLLDDAGYAKGPDGIRAKNGKPLKFNIAVPGGYSDWVSDCQIISDNAKAIGMQVTLQTPSADAWTTNTYNGDFDLTLFTPMPSLTPYRLYHECMGVDTVQPIGKATPVNMQRFSDATASQLLVQFTKETDRAQQKATMNQIQSRFAEIAPMIPLYGAPDWGLFTTRRFTGFPDQTNQFAPLTLQKGPSTFLVYPHLSPVG